MNIQIQDGDEFYLWLNDCNQKMIYVVRDKTLYYTSALKGSYIDNRYKSIDCGDYELVSSSYNPKDLKIDPYFKVNQLRKLPYSEVALIDLNDIFKSET